MSGSSATPRPAPGAERLLLEIRRAVGGADPDSPAVRRRLERIANRAGVAPLLVRTLRQGDVLAAHVAALALPHARGELVRRALRRAARELTGERRAVVLAALTDEELDEVLAELGDDLSEDLVSASAILAVNSPREFVDLLCDGLPIVDERVVDHVEKVRKAFGIGAASVYGPLLERRLTAPARRRAVEVLGREPGPDVARVLDQQSTRSLREEDRRLVRRERMRQASAELSGRAAAHEGRALLSALGPGGAAFLEIFERSRAGKVLRTTVVLGPGGAGERFSAPVAGDLDAAVAAAQGEGLWAPMTLGQARGLLESLPRGAREGLGPVLERLASTPAQPPPGPPPGPPLGAEEARALLAEPLWSEWRPLSRAAGWPDDALEATARLSAERFPCDPGALAEPARAQLDALRARRLFLARVAAGLRHMALVMHLRGDGRAAGVATDALWLARGRRPELALAMVERELWLQLWTYARLPDAYRARVREAVRRALGLRSTKAGWDDVRTLDLAQAAAEGLARAAGETARRAGLPAVASLDLDAAVELAGFARESLSDKALRRRVRAGAFGAIAEEAGAWLGTAPVQASWELARFAGSVCLGACPHHCFDREPGTDAASVAGGDCPCVPAGAGRERDEAERRSS